MVRLTLIAFALVVAGCAKQAPALPGPPHGDALQQLRADLASVVSQPGLRATTWGIAVESMSSGDRLFEANPGTLLVPASALKIVTTAATAAAVGWDYTFETVFAINGSVDAGVLHGDLIIIGSGDPSLGGRGGTDVWAPLLAALREHNITRIDGRVVGDDDAVEEPRPGLAWSWDDLGTVTGAVAGGLNFGENIVPVTVVPSEPGGPTMLLTPPDSRDFPLINRSVTGPRGSPGVWAEQRPGDPAVTIAGTVSVNQGPTTLSVAVGNPTLWTATVLRARLIMSGIEITGPAVDADDLRDRPVAGTVILRQRSRSLRDIVAPMLKNSINMYADAILRIATGPDGPRTIVDGVVAEKRRLQDWGIADRSVQPVDGSGLSRFNLITAEALVRVLKQMKDTPQFVAGLPIAGVDGTLENRMKDTPAANHVRAKTGSMTNVRSLAGYVTTKDGETLAFAIIANNFESSPATIMNAIDQIVVKLASFSR